VPPRPKPDVDLNLDSYERSEPPKPFSVLIGGKRYVLRDAPEIDYRELLEGFHAAQAGDPAPSIRAIVAEKDRDAFFANELPGYKMTELFAAYNEHFGLNPGEAGASPTS
jgi:hypothetical protein